MDATLVHLGEKQIKQKLEKMDEGVLSLSLSHTHIDSLSIFCPLG